LTAPSQLRLVEQRRRRKKKKKKKKKEASGQAQPLQSL
jgi:hypothetical protein